MTAQPDNAALLEEVRRGLRAARDRRRGEERDHDFLRELAVAGLQATDSLAAALAAAEERAQAAEQKLVAEHRRRVEADAQVDGLVRAGGEWLIERLRAMADALIDGNDTVLREGLDLYRVIEEKHTAESQLAFDKWAYRAFGPDGPIRAALTPYDEKARAVLARSAGRAET